MKIAHVTVGLSRQGAGVKAVVEALSAAQAAQGHEVRVFGVADAAWQNGDSALWLGAEAVACRRYGPAALGYAPDLLARLCQFAPDIVHLHGLWMYPSRSVLRWHKRTMRPYLISVHGMLSTVALGFSPTKKRIAGLLFQDANLARAAALHATHDGERDEIRAFNLTNPVIVAPIGIHSAPIPLDLAPEPTLRVLSLGRLHPKKGLDRLIAAWATLEEDFPDWSLDIVGPDEGGHGAQLQQQIAQLRLQRVAIRPPLVGVARDRCMAGAQLFALPSLSENFALTVAESLMMAVPVISTTGAPWQGLTENACGWWIDHGVANLSNTLRQAMSLDAATRKQMGQRGREWMLRDFAWPSVAAQMLDAYSSIVGKGGI